MKLDLSVSKGMGIQMVFFAISMAAVIAGLAAFAQAQKLPPAFGQTVDELGSVTKPEHRLEDTVNHYIPLSAHYGVAEAAYNISTNNTNFTGHADPHVSTGPTEGDDDADEMERYTHMIDYVDTRSQSYFEEYIQTLDYDDCQVRMDNEAKVNLSYASTQVNVSAGTNRPLINVSCETPQIDVYTETELGKELSLNISNLRFHELASITVNTSQEMEDVSETLESNGKHYSSITSSSACSFNEGSYPSISDARDAAEDASYSQAVNDAYDRVDDFEAAIVDEGNGYTGPDRGAEEVLKKATTSNAFCVFGFCLTQFWVDDISYDAYVRDNETSVTSVSNSSSQCGCANFDCNQDPDSEYNYVAVADACEHDDENGVGSNPYSADCDPGEFKDGGSCYNSSTPPRSFEGDPTCSEEDFEHDGSGGCELDEEDSISDSSGGRPNPQCVNKKYSAQSTVDYEYERIEVQVNLTDDKFVIPTSDGFTNLYMNRKFIRNFEKPPP
ncbi:hypothetical protein GLT81_00145 [Nanohaloarchaea archaeon]|nr:hypothetical protein [Candidatus Nanohaloarchaea archaeon]